MEASELDAFLAAAAGRPSAGADGDNDVLAEVDGLAANEAGELVALAAACGGRRRFGQRSSELTQHARNIHVRKRQQAKLDAERAKRQRSEIQLTVLVAADPGMMQLVGVTLPNVNLPLEVRAGLTLRLACLPRIRSALFDKQRKKQTNALALVSQVLQERSMHCWEGLLATAPPGAGMGVPAAMRVLMFACQWDETSQKFKPVPAKGPDLDKPGNDNFRIGSSVHGLQWFHRGEGDQARGVCAHRALLRSNDGCGRDECELPARGLAAIAAVLLRGPSAHDPAQCCDRLLRHQCHS